ncbi:MAG: Ldh family oxidoreductase [Moorea sp. SIO3I7]|uniref:Ldh family oxidoreductase n=1 Tax=Moorena sp. SIO3I8 TaxID=2607833 RepID=UPI0013C13231|nr:Ldh family oxidoreductase [Moorena sp. SIO3I8]NEN98414.1 Ldh family oxidoreductase [Moorena sp. SIO3I7]NEO07166.1 Ldh family oxidoreductase [Moorena sp. SIO3I8]
MDSFIRVDPEKLQEFINDILCAEGIDAHEALIIAKIFVWFDLIGRTTQGVARLPAYLERFRKHLIKSPCVPKFIQKSATINLVDGHDGFGHYLGHVSMLKAIEIANKYGVGMVLVSHSNHFGAGAYYVQLAAQNSQLGLAFSNSFPHVAPYGGVTAVLGTNPFAFAAPVRNKNSIIVDFSTGATAGSVLRKTVENNQKITEGILIDENSNAIVDPRKAAQGVILPFGGAKGFCLGLMVEIISGVISGSGISHEIASMYKNFDRSANVGHFFMAIDISKIMPMVDYYQRLETLISFIQTAKTSNDFEEIILPGETRWRNYAEQLDRGISLEIKTVKILKELAKHLNIKNYF